MTKIGKKIWVLGWILIAVISLIFPVSWSGKSWAQNSNKKKPTVVASFDPDKPIPHEPVEFFLGDDVGLFIKVESDSSLNVEDPVLPDHLEGLEQISDKPFSQFESVASSFGQVSEIKQTLTFKFLLKANKVGQFEIPPLVVKVGGEALKTNSVKIKIVEPTQVQLQKRKAQQEKSQQEEENPEDDMEDIFNQLLRRRMGGLPRGGGFGGGSGTPVRLEDSFFIKAEVDKQKAYVGEQVTATWWLYTRAQIHDIDTLKYPDLKGFWKEEIELATRLNFQQEMINGVVYQKALLASYALFPIKVGEATVDPYQAKCTVSSPSFFGFSKPQRLVKSSQPITLQIVDVPQEGRPADYTGAVGQFTAEAHVEQNTAVANQPLKLKIRYEGRGNAKLLDLPPLHLPSSLEIYDTQQTAKFFREGTSFKEFNVILIPREAGSLQIPSLTLSAFSPEKGRFYRVETQPISLSVLPGKGLQAGGSQPMAELDKPKKEAPLTMPDLVTQWESEAQSWPFPKWIFLTALYVVVLSLLGWKCILVSGRFQKKRDLRKILSRRCGNVKRYADQQDWRKVGSEGTNLVYFILGEITGQGGAHHELAKLLLEAPPSVRRELTEPLTRLLQTLELLSFAPEALVGNLKNKAELYKVVAQLSQILGQALQLVDQGGPEKLEQGVVT